MTSLTQNSRSGLNWMKRVTSFYRVRRDEQWLSQLDDRMLKDIGLHRSEIGRAVRDGFPPRKT
jgi:uncharacterized protein YjiS (DUF1127 family)